MDFKTRYPEYADVEHHIRHARLERSVAIAHFIAAGVEAIVRGARGFLDAMSRGVAAEADQRAIEADAFLRRSLTAPHR